MGGGGACLAGILLSSFFLSFFLLLLLSFSFTFYFLFLLLLLSFSFTITFFLVVECGPNDLWGSGTFTSIRFGISYSVWNVRIRTSSMKKKIIAYSSFSSFFFQVHS